MTTNNFLIGPIRDALRKDIKPYATPDDSFETLNNAFQFRGRVVRRYGYTTLGRLSPDGMSFPGNPVMGLRTRDLVGFGPITQQLVAFDTTTAYFYNGTVFNELPSTMPTVWSGTDSQFFYSTNYAAAFWATNFKPGLHGIAIDDITNVNPAVVQTAVPHGFTTGQSVAIINVSGYAPLAATTPILNGQVFVITVVDATHFSITIDGTLYGAYSSGGMALNNQVSITGQDGIRYYAPTLVGDTWVNYNPPIDPNNALAGALLIFPYRGYLVFLNTWEGNEIDVFNYPNRARWTQIGTPYYSAPVPNSPSLQGIDPNAARDDLFGRGGANDAPTTEAIIGAAFIRDILVVYFENSTWRLRFVNNAQNPFVWERVNVEFGSDSTFSAVPFDKGLMAIGTRGIIISDGNDTVRIDDKIPDEIFKIRQENEGLNRVHGIRTFDTRLVYWTFPNVTNPDGIYPDNVLVYNYDTKNWSYFDDCYTCFGYYYPSQGGDKTWNDLTEPWQSYNDLTWGSGSSQQGYENIVAGNQQGYVLILEQTDGANGPSLSVDAFVGNVITSPNNNLPDGTWIKLTGVTGITLSDGTSLNDRNFKISNPTFDPNDFSLNEFDPISAGDALGASFNYNIGYVPIIPGSVQVNVGTLVFTDNNSDGLLFVNNVASGTVDYTSGALVLNFNPPIISTPVFIRVVSLNENQTIDPISTTGVYAGGGEITKISNFDIITKIFNFFKDNKRARLSRVDFYVNNTENGQFTCNVFPDSSNAIANLPLPDNPQSNVVLTSNNPYQFGEGDQTIYRLYCDVIAQTIQLQLTMSDHQMATDAINSSDFELIAMMISMRRGGRLI